MTKRLAILGDGVTGKALRLYAAQENIPCVSVAEADLIISSPGIPADQLPVTTTPILSELAYSRQKLEALKKRPYIIAVTGTNGKTTVSSLLGHILDAPVLGNIGTPLISIVNQQKLPPIIVVEVSSFQLECCEYFHADMLLFLNLQEDHLDRHKSFDIYVQQKNKLVISQTSTDTLIYNQEDAIIADLAKKSLAKTYAFTSSISPNFHLQKNLFKANISAVVKACNTLKLTDQFIQDKLTSFNVPEHRLEYVTTRHQSCFYNDSKATNPSATIAALKQFDQNIYLILCGQNKGLSFEALKVACHATVIAIYVFGDIQNEILKTFKDSHITTIACKTLQESIQLSYEHSKNNKGEQHILFSPAAASFDQFKNYQDRGQQFKQKVHALIDSCKN
eukprot:COSAG01_NODE_9_length_43729_cov_66.133463_32_plen_393_part_00